MSEQRPEFAEKLHPFNLSAWEFDESGWVHFLADMEDIDDSDMAASQAGLPHPEMRTLNRITH